MQWIIAVYFILFLMALSYELYFVRKSRRKKGKTSSASVAAMRLIKDAKNMRR